MNKRRTNQAVPANNSQLSYTMLLAEYSVLVERYDALQKRTKFKDQLIKQLRTK